MLATPSIRKPFTGFIEKHLTITTTVKYPRAFAQLHKVVLARITLLNHISHCSGAARLIVPDWVQRHEWIEGAKLNVKQRVLLQRYSVAFAIGKRLSLTGILPHQLHLADSTVREKARVSHTNRLLFATQRIPRIA